MNVNEAVKQIMSGKNYAFRKSNPDLHVRVMRRGDMLLPNLFLYKKGDKTPSQWVPGFEAILATDWEIGEVKED